MNDPAFLALNVGDGWEKGGGLQLFSISGLKPKPRYSGKYGEDFPGGPVAKTLCSLCRGPGFNPWSGN